MMLDPKNLSLLFTVVLLAITAYFLLGSVPLLVLNHDNPIDASFIRSFYITYFKIAIIVAVGAAASHALSGRPAFAVGAAAIAMLTWWVRARFIPRMDLLTAKIQANDAIAIQAFRKIHKSAITINSVQLMAILVSLGSL